MAEVPAFDPLLEGQWWFVGTNFRVLTFSIMFYILFVRQLEDFFRDRKPLNIPRIIIFHNFLSFVMSAVLQVGFWSSLLRAYRDGAMDNVWEIMCDPSGRLWPYVAFWIHMFYLSKYYELLDTVLLALRKKRISFLHFFHHSSYIFPCYGCAVTGLTMQFVPSVWNSFVHFFMYFYYLMMVTRFRGHFKNVAKYITQLQIAQFILGNIQIGITYYQHYVLKMKVHGDIRWMIFQSAMTLGFLKLFVDMFQGRYKPPQKKKGEEYRK